MFDQSFLDYLEKYKNMTEEEFNALQPMQPPLPPGKSIIPNPPPLQEMTPEERQRYRDMPLPPPPPPPPPPGYDPNLPEIEANASPGLLDMNRMAMSMGQGSDTLAGGGGNDGLLGSGYFANLGDRPWGPMLMALGGGIASGAHQGWGAGLGAGFQGAAAARMRGEENAQQEAYRQAVLAAKQAELNKGPAPTDDMREYAAAKDQGYEGSLMDFMLATKGASATRINNTVGGKYGTIPKDYELVEDPNTGAASMRVIPGSETDKAEKAAASASASKSEDTAEKSDVMLDAIAGIRDAQNNSKMPAVGPGTQYLSDIPFTDTAATRVRGYTETLKSGVALEKIKEMKAQSQTGATGFGALNQEELKLLVNDMGSLNPDGDKKVFNETVDRIEKRWSRVKEDAKKNISPERWKQLGLDDVFGPRNGGGGGWEDLGGGVRIRAK